jgi:hypothetical protein
MREVILRVVPRDGTWSIQFNERPFGTFADQKAAVEAAVAVAGHAVERKCNACVLIQAFDDWYQKLWENGQATTRPRLTPTEPLAILDLKDEPHRPFAANLTS